MEILEKEIKKLQDLTRYRKNHTNHPKTPPDFLTEAPPTSFQAQENKITSVEPVEKNSALDRNGMTQSDHSTIDTKINMIAGLLNPKIKQYSSDESDNIMNDTVPKDKYKSGRLF